MARLEYAETAAQQFNIQSGAMVIPRSYDADHMRSIHRQLFGNVYEWAGEYRTVTILKGFSEFAPLGSIPQYLADASRMIGSADWPAMDKSSFAAAVATVFAYVNQAHPFREGNGRASKLFMQHVSELSPYRISWSPTVSGVTPEIWNQASMLSGPDRGKYEPVPVSLEPVFRAMTVDRA